MTEVVEQPAPGTIVKLSGTITHYRCSREEASFVYSEQGQSAFGVVAVGAALAGLGGQAASAAASANSLQEAADYLQFTLDGKPVEGWVWRSPFKEGDRVEVAAEWVGDHYEAYAIARPADRTVALYPHCSRGVRSHMKNTVKWGALWHAFILGGFSALLYFVGGTELFKEPVFFWACGALFLFFSLMVFSMSRQYLRFAKLADQVFHVLGLPNAEGLDLGKTSSAQRTAEDPGEFGTFYFRY